MRSTVTLRPQNQDIYKPSEFIRAGESGWLQMEAGHATNSYVEDGKIYPRPHLYKLEHSPTQIRQD